MKKAVAILLLGLYLLSATQLGQLCKLPALFGHFQQHRQQDPKITFVEFFVVHYASDFVQDEDYDQDQKLPFKAIDNSFSYSLGAIVNQPMQWSCSNWNPSRIQHNTAFVSKGVPTAFIHTIWQPPRVANQA
ncbi:MAG TPA: hypothetical protein PLU10_01485 [Chitinophagaceae bacterium]|nr:hypothetical protein [Chitinophagaceae bacterium]